MHGTSYLKMALYMFLSRLVRDARRPPCDGRRIDSHEDPEDDGVCGMLAAIALWYKEYGKEGEDGAAGALPVICRASGPCCEGTFVDCW